jgi:hypothetical protein
MIFVLVARSPGEVEQAGCELDEIPGCYDHRIFEAQPQLPLALVETSTESSSTVQTVTAHTLPLIDEQGPCHLNGEQSRPEA